MAFASDFLRNSAGFLLDAFDGVLGGEAPGEAGRRQAFISANLLAGAIGIVAWPAHWLVLGPVDLVTGIGFAFLWMPLALGAWVKGGGDVEAGEAASSILLATFVNFLAAFTGGLASPLLPWLLVVPAEAAVSGRQRAVTASALTAGAGVLAIGCVTLAGVLPPSRLGAGASGFVYAVSLFAALGTGGLALRALHLRSVARLARAEAIAEWHRATAEGTADMITRHALDGRIGFASAATEMLTGIKPGEAAGLSPSMFVHVQDVPQVLQAFERAQAGETERVEFRLRRRDGSHVPVEMTLGLAGGDVIAVTRDLSEFAARIANLTAELAQAEETGRSRSRFLASVTHELRTPLNAIIGFADMMRSEILGPLGNARYREYAELIRTSGLHLVDLVSDLLDMSKLEAGKFTIERKPCDLKIVAEECLALSGGGAEAAGVELVSDLGEDLKLSADARALKQCLLNLLSNAVKFTPAGGTVTLSAHRCGEMLEIGVADTGVGIPAKDLERIGRPFEQAEGEAQRAHRGTGLGLSLVKALTELHGGTMEIRSAPGDGTTVRLTLPLQAQDEGTLVYPEKFRARA